MPDGFQRGLNAYKNEQYKLAGPLSFPLRIKAGEGMIKMGDVLSIDTTAATPTLKKWVTGEEAFTIAFHEYLGEYDATGTNDILISVLSPGSEFNVAKINQDLTVNPEIFFQLWKNGIILRKVI